MFLLMSVYKLPREVKEAMLNFIDLCKKKGSARMISANTNVAGIEVVGFCMRLDAAGALTEDIVRDVLTRLTICLTVAFIQNATLGNFGVLTTITNSSVHIEKIKAIFNKAIDIYDLFVTP